jgi:MFS family permease
MRASASPIYYGWFVLAAGAVSEILAQGATSYSAGLFVLPLQGEFQLSRANASSAILILFAGGALLAPLVGRMLDRYPLRLMMAGGALLFALSLAGIAATSSLWLMVLLLFLPAAAGAMSIGPLMTATLASRWFHRRRGLALGLAAVATSGGGLLVPLISAGIARHGWRQTLFYEAGALCVIIVALALLVVRDRPASVALDTHPENAGGGQGAGTATWSGILSTVHFWIPSLTLAGISGTAQATVTVLVPYAVGLGYSPASAALLVTIFAVAAAITKILAGLLADRVNRRLLLVAAALLMTLSWLVLSLSSAYPALAVASGLAGTALGCALPTVTTLIAAHFGPENFGRVMGVTYFLIPALAILAVRFSGSIFDATGGYRESFEVFAALLGCLFLATAFFAARRSPV